MRAIRVCMSRCLKFPVAFRLPCPAQLHTFRAATAPATTALIADHPRSRITLGSCGQLRFTQSREIMANASRKRKASHEPIEKEDSQPSPSSNGTKSQKISHSHGFDHSRAAEKYGIVNRKYYPAEMSNERCAQYSSGEIPKPMNVLEKTLTQTSKQRDEVKAGEVVVHWFKRDLRLADNRALSKASKKAQGAGVPLVCVFLVSPQDYEAHSTSRVRVDFELRTLEVMKHDLKELDIPLYVETVEQRKKVPKRLLELCGEWGAKHLFANIEYEVDELRREEKLLKAGLDRDIAVMLEHDDVITLPGSLKTGPGHDYSVYSPWYRAWVKHVHAHPELLECPDNPAANKTDAVGMKLTHLFETDIPNAPRNKSLTADEKKFFASLWPAGEHEAQDRLEKFVQERIKKYKDTRNFPGQNSTSMLSVHLSTGTLSARTAVRRARDANTVKKLDGGAQGISGWISEIAWRDFYKHVLCAWPYVCMHKSFKYEYSDIEWEYNQDHFEKWCNGQTGYPYIDAGMRQLKETGYLHNRVRMGVASFLTKDLLLDWRMGEKHFMEHLIDGDFASNNGGWGFSASSGVDPQPYFRIFNPILQGEKFDPDGEYIRKWVPELKNVQGKAIHDPYGRGAEKQAKDAGYPRMIVDHKESRNRALERYKRGLKRDTA